MDSKYKLIFIVISAVIIHSCGTKPSPEIIPSQSPEKLWQYFSSKYDSIESLAFKGDFTLSGERTYKTNLQLVYAAPDSFAFLAEAALGIDAARGAIIHGRGFWEIPREDYSESITLLDQIRIDNYEVDLESILQSVFFFKGLKNYEYLEKNGNRLIYCSKGMDRLIIIELNKDSGTPISLIFNRFSLFNPVIYEANYYDWRKSGDGMLFPGRIELSSTSNKLKVEYVLSRIKANPDLPQKLFAPRKKR